MKLFERLFNNKKYRQRQEEIRLEKERIDAEEDKKRLEEERIKLEQEKLRLEEEKRLIEREKKILEENKKLEERLKNEEERRLKEQIKAEEEYVYWQEWALNKQKLLIEEEKKRLEKNIGNNEEKVTGEAYEHSSELTLNKYNNLIEHKTFDVDEQYFEKRPLYNTIEYEFPLDFDIEYKPYLEKLQYPKYPLFSWPAKFDIVKRYKDDIYLKQGYDNIGYSSLYEGKLNYESYEDILDFIDCVNDRH